MFDDVYTEYCLPLSDIDNGDITYSLDANTPGNYPVSTIATHMCETDFGLVGGISQRTCSNASDATGEGTWNGDDITCQM